MPGPFDFDPEELEADPDDPPEPSPEERAAWEAWRGKKERYARRVLGPPAGVVGHSIIPFPLGGALHQYYHPKLPDALTGGGGGTAILTGELSPSDGEGPSNRAFNNYELAMFTRERFTKQARQAPDGDTPFNRAAARIAAFLNPLARYLTEADVTLHPGETMEFPADFDEEIGGACLVVAAVPVPKGPRIVTDPPKPARFGLLCPIVVTRKEMNWARKHGGHALLEKLDDAGHFPFSDPGRKVVIGGLLGGTLK